MSKFSFLKYKNLAITFLILRMKCGQAPSTPFEFQIYCIKKFKLHLVKVLSITTNFSSFNIHKFFEQRTSIEVLTLEKKLSFVINFTNSWANYLFNFKMLFKLKKYCKWHFSIANNIF